MRAHSAAPGAGYTRAASTGDTAGHRTRSIAELNLPAHVLHALEAEGVGNLDDWRRLGRRRLRVFGITPRTAALLDAAARDAAVMKAAKELQE